MTDNGASAAEVVEGLRRTSGTIASSESLTGGLFAATLTSVPGASAVVRGAVVVYATDLKATLGGVDAKILAAEGPVSAAVAGQLARSVRVATGSSWGVSMTGVAGPDTQDGHPVGTVFIAICGANGSTVIQQYAFSGDRESIRLATVQAVLDLVLRTVQH